MKACGYCDVMEGHQHQPSCPHKLIDEQRAFVNLYYPETEHPRPPRLEIGDAVVLPNHYARFPIEPTRFIAENKLNWFQGNVVKYICRAEHKNGIEDLRKAARYIEMYIDYLEGNADFWKPNGGRDA